MILVVLFVVSCVLASDGHWAICFVSSQCFWLHVYVFPGEWMPFDVSPVKYSDSLWFSIDEVLFVLWFYGLVNPIGSCRAQSVYLITLLLGRLSPLSGQPVLCNSFARNWHLPFLISGRERMTVENISWSILTKECCRPRAGRTRNLLITSWTRIQLSHRGRLINEVEDLCADGTYICSLKLHQN